VHQSSQLYYYPPPVLERRGYHLEKVAVKVSLETETVLVATFVTIQNARMQDLSSVRVNAEET